MHLGFFGVANKRSGVVPPAQQAHLTNFYILWRAVFAIGRFFALPATEVPK